MEAGHSDPCTGRALAGDRAGQLGDELGREPLTRAQVAAVGSGMQTGRGMGGTWRERGQG